MKIGSLLDLKLPSLVLGGCKLEWINEIKYLGVVFNAGKKFYVDVNFNSRKYLETSFTILQKCKYSSEVILYKLIFANCLPTLLNKSKNICGI